MADDVIPTLQPPARPFPPSVGEFSTSQRMRPAEALTHRHLGQSAQGVVVVVTRIPRSTRETMKMEDVGALARCCGIRGRLLDLAAFSSRSSSKVRLSLFVEGALKGLTPSRAR